MYRKPGSLHNYLTLKQLEHAVRTAIIVIIAVVVVVTVVFVFLQIREVGRVRDRKVNRLEKAC